MADYKLIYFPVRGNGELIRQIFAVAGENFEDYRLKEGEWETMKSEMPFGQLPVLEENGQKIAQTYAISRYLARKFGLAGKTPWQEAEVDALADQWQDFQTEVRPYFLVKNGFEPGDRKNLKQTVFKPAIRKHFLFFVAALKKNGGSGYLIGDSLTWIDLPVAEFVSQVDKKAPGWIDKVPELREHYKMVHKTPELKKWRESRPGNAY